MLSTKKIKRYNKNILVNSYEIVTLYQNIKGFSGTVDVLFPFEMNKDTIYSNVNNNDYKYFVQITI